jgi:metallo-beta-lactamase class B
VPLHYSQEMRSIIIAFALVAASQAPSSILKPDPDKVCERCAGWNMARQPLRIFGNTYYVGPDGLSSLLVASDAGHILLDGGLQQSAAVIDANIRALGFRTQDIRLIVASHAHYDHVGGIAALQRASGAIVAMSAPGVKALVAGGPTPDDPQYAIGVQENAFPPIANTRAVKDGETLQVGSLSITAHLTPGHTPGGTSWTWRSCEGTRCLNMVYADSLTVASADGFRFTGGDGHPDITPTFRATIAKVEALPCDVIVSTHPGATGLADKIKRRDSGAGIDAFIDTDSCRKYAANARLDLDRRIARERRYDHAAR